MKLLLLLLCLAQVGPGLERFDQLMRAQLRQHGCPGGALALVKDQRLVFIQGYGWADREGRVPVRATTVFALASVSKTLTATGVLHLVEEGRLRLDEPIFPYIEPLAPRRMDPRVRGITLRMLLNHSSGFQRKGDVDDPSEPLEDQIRATLAEPLHFDPGSQAVYSNFGFTLAGYIAARAAGQPYADFMQSQVIEPLRMPSARLPGNESDYAPDEARRYGPQGRLLSAALSPNAGPAGGWEASPLDLARFLVGFRTYLTPASLQQMLTPPPGGHFGLGWDRTDGSEYTKNGGLPGVHSQIGRAGGVDYVILFNGGQGKVIGPATRQVTELIRATPSWPHVDYFSR